MNLKAFSISALSTIISVTFTACSESDLSDSTIKTPSEAQAIVFHVEDTPSPSRSTSTVLTDFKVEVLDDGQSYIDSPMSVFSTDNGVSWTSSSKIYWPSSHSASWSGLTFVAYEDLNSSSSSFCLADGIAAFTDFEVSPEVNKQAELLYAVAKNVRNASPSGCVNLHFKNALTPVSFSAQNNNPSIENIELLSIELGGVKGQATYRFPQSSTSTETGTWTISANSYSTSYCISDINLNLGSCASNGNGEIFDISSSTRDCDGNVMMLIPQTLNEGAYIKVTSRITPKGEQGDTFISEESFPISVDWSEGQGCKYHIVWNDSSTSFEISVADFREVDITADI